MANPGVSQIVYTGFTGQTDITILGTDLTTDAVATLTRIFGATAGGAIRSTGNKSYDFTIGVKVPDQQADVEALENIFGTLEVYSLDDNVTPAITFSNVNPLVNDQVVFDPSDEDNVHYEIQHQGVQI